VDPIASGPDYATDAARARAFQPLVAQGHAASIVEAAFRFALTTEALSTALIGTSDLAQLDFAAAAATQGPLSAAAMESVRALWARLGAH
jgi:aryl-alcohol dehydrogenase-like predicted oxidoreductase